MRIRAGFVSNSSSTAFILDLRKEEVKEFVEANRHVSLPVGLNRGTALAVGMAAVEYGRQWKADCDWNDCGLGHWILSWALELGTDNIVFARESDEGMGGFLTGDKVYEIAETEMEYH